MSSWFHCKTVYLPNNCHFCLNYLYGYYGKYYQLSFGYGNNLSTSSVEIDTAHSEALSVLFDFIIMNNNSYLPSAKILLQLFAGKKKRQLNALLLSYNKQKLLQ